MWGKKVLMWYNHRLGTFSARLAGILAQTILYTSSYSFFSQSAKAIQMPVGVDTDLFSPGFEPREEAILFLGRIAPVKHLETLIEAAHIFDTQNIHIPIHIYGSALPRDKNYFDTIMADAEPLVEKGLVTFHGSIPYQKSPDIYRKYSIFANFTPSGSFDKTIIEAMASGSLVLASNKSFEEILPMRYDSLMVFEERNATEFAQKVAQLVKLTPAEKESIGKELRDIVMKNHSDMKLQDRLVEVCKK
jgi:glycosyltransferase involved in cell wall biosynthesis